MSEYWKSTPKYWCKHCSTYVKDTPFEKKQHESTGKHQGNLKRFLRGIQNDHERDERDKQKAKTEVDRLNRMVGGSTSMGSISTPALKRAIASPGSQISPADRKKQLAQLVEMGIAIPDEYQADMALAGDWNVVSQRKIAETEPEEQLSTGVRKRKLEDDDEEEEPSPEVVRRGWGSTTRRYPDEGKSDLDVLLSSTKIKKPDEDEQKPTIPAVPDSSSIKNETATGSTEAVVKAEKAEQSAHPVLNQIPQEPTIPIFKKRRPKNAAT